MRVAVVTSDPGISRGILGELEPVATRFTISVLHPLEAVDQLVHHPPAVVLVDLQAIPALQPAAFTDAVCGASVQAGFLACCSACPADRDRIAAVELAGGHWLPLPSSGTDLWDFIEKVHSPPDAALARVSFLAAFWELAADAASLPEPAPRPRSWVGSLGDLLAKLLRQRPIAENGG